MSFTGIPLAALDFYEDLEDDNTKKFWTEHKTVYDESVRAPLEALAADLAREFGESKLFRPYRDVRFAKDKTPYKTHQGVWFPESSLYLQVSASGLRVAGGYWDTTTAQVDRLRRGVADDVAGAELERAVSSALKAGFELGGRTLTRVPSGYDARHSRAELLKRRALTGSKDFRCPAWLSTTRTRSEVAKAWRRLAPVIAWLDTHVGHD